MPEATYFGTGLVTWAVNLDYWYADNVVAERKYLLSS